MTDYHAPVMPDEVRSFFTGGGVILDGTVGGGGHSFALLADDKNRRLICSDKDGEALRFAKIRLAAYSERVTFIHSDFKEIGDVGELDGVLLDLGVSSRQLDDKARGFSYVSDGSLDMRMDASQSFSAADIAAKYSERELERIIREYGEERYSRRIAAAIVRERDKRPITSTAALAELVKRSVPFSPAGGHPAKRTFQAFRIEVNGELEGLSDALKGFTARLKKGGRIAVISFHSLEDRIVKNTFKELAASCVCPPKAPVCVCGKRAEVKILTRKPVVPSEREIKENPRAASAKLRVAEKT